MEADSSLVYVPGDWYCPMCGFRVHKRILNPVNLAIGIDTSEVAEACPNDGEQLQPLTWKQDCEDANKVALNLMKQLQRQQERLDELEPVN